MENIRLQQDPSKISDYKNMLLKIDTTKQTVQYLETGRRPSYEVLVKLENLFNLSHRDLLEQVPYENILTE